MTLVPPYIQNLKNYVPGKSIDAVRKKLGIDEIYKLASNENPNGPSPKAVLEIQKSLQDMHRYPDPSGANLRSKLAKKFDIKMENVIIGSGSEGIMTTIMRTFLLKDDEIVSAKNSFIGFRVLANASGKKIHWAPMKNHKYDLSAMLEYVSDKTKIIYIANPDNPMGTFITQKEFDQFYAQIPKKILIILDEAYFEYCQNNNEYPNSMSYRYDNVITLRTFSKAYGLAGLRIGYGFAHETLIENLMKVKEPFTPSLLAINGAIAALDDNEFLLNSIKSNNKEASFVQNKLNQLQIKTVPSSANFITTIWPSKKIALSITEQLLNKGVIVRYLGPFGWPEYVRFSIGTNKENLALINEISQIMTQ